MKLLDAVQTLYVRADADSTMGTGHVMRSLALAQAWKEQGGKAVFISRIEGEKLINRVVDEGFQVVTVENSHPHPEDLQQVRQIIASAAMPRLYPHWLVVDGYHFDASYQEALANSGCRILVIDDMAHLPEYHADLLLNQNIYAQELEYQATQKAKLLFGPRFTLLRKEVLALGESKKKMPEQAGRILVTLGGADPENITLFILQALEETGLTDLEVKVVVGPSNRHLKELAKASREFSYACELLTAVDDMPSLMCWADMAVAAGGTTCWELAFMGVPFAVLVLAQNQHRVASGLAKLGAAVNLGWVQSLTLEAVSEALNKLLSSRRKREEIAGNGMKLFDGQGALRTVKRMLATDLYFRNVCFEDCPLLYEWANDPGVRKASFNSNPISWHEHQSWFAAKLKDSKSRLFIVETCNRVPIGQARFDIYDDFVVVSVSLSKEFRGLGLGGEFIRKACEQLFLENKDVSIRAYIKSDNEPSLTAFSAAGFQEKEKAQHKGMPTTVMEYYGPGKKSYEEN